MSKAASSARCFVFWDLETKLLFLLIHNFIDSAHVLTQAFPSVEPTVCHYAIVLPASHSCSKHLWGSLLP